MTLQLQPDERDLYRQALKSNGELLRDIITLARKVLTSDNHQTPQSRLELMRLAEECLIKYR